MQSSFSKLLKKEIFTPVFFASSFGIALMYIFFSLSILNYRLVINTLFGSYPLFYKSSIFLAVLESGWTAFPFYDFVILIINALLVGYNLVLLIQNMKRLQQQGNVELSVGGATLLSVVTAGCGGCGLSLLAILGLSTSFSFLPLKGLELHILATLALAFSFVYMLRKLHQEVYCKVERRLRG